MQPLVPLLTDRDADARIPIQEHLVTFGDQPLMQLISTYSILAGIADEDPGHRTYPIMISLPADL